MMSWGFPVPQLPLSPAQQRYEGQRHLRGLRHWKANSTLQSHVAPSAQLGLPKVSAVAVAPSPTVVVEPFAQGALPHQNCCWNIKSNPSFNYIFWPLTTYHSFGVILRVYLEICTPVQNVWGRHWYTCWYFQTQCTNYEDACFLKKKLAYKLHTPPKSNGWNLKIMVSNRNLLFQQIFRFHVEPQGCIWASAPVLLMGPRQGSYSRATFAARKPGAAVGVCWVQQKCQIAPIEVCIWIYNKCNIMYTYQRICQVLVNGGR